LDEPARSQRRLRIRAIQDGDARVAFKRTTAVVAEGEPDEEEIAKANSKLPTRVVQPGSAVTLEDAQRRDPVLVESPVVADVQRWFGSDVEDSGRVARVDVDKPEPTHIRLVQEGDEHPQPVIVER
jgi:hypothetical protein